MAQPILGLHIFIPFCHHQPPVATSRNRLQLAVALAVTYLSRYPPSPRRLRNIAVLRSIAVLHNIAVLHSIAVCTTRSPM
jgi:hypothetical protein